MAAVTLVTGGLGFIGSHLVERLIEAGDHVLVIDNRDTGKPSNLEAIASNPNLSVIDADVSDFGAIRPHFKGVKRVFHLAALASIVPSIDAPLDYFRTNVTGTVNVLEASRLSGVERLVYAASSSCYGIPNEYPTPESATSKPEYPYALTKYLGEQTVLHWGKVFGIGVASLRLFNVYGPRARTTSAYGAVLGVFLAQKLAGKPLTIVGNGEQTRDFTYVADVTEAFVQASESDISGEVMNVGSGDTYSVNRLAAVIGGPTVNIPQRPGDPDRTFADIRKIRAKLGWTPRVGFDKGVKMTLKHIDEWSGAPVWTPEAIAERTEAWFRLLGDDTSSP